MVARDVTDTMPDYSLPAAAAVERSNRLPLLADQIRLGHAGVRQAAKTATEHAIAAGRALREAKSLLKHGQWLDWLREHCRLPARTAQLYMRIAELVDVHGFKSATVADLGIRRAGNLPAEFFARRSPDDIATDIRRTLRDHLFQIGCCLAEVHDRADRNGSQPGSRSCRCRLPPSRSSGLSRLKRRPSTWRRFPA